MPMRGMETRFFSPRWAFVAITMSLLYTRMYMTNPSPSPVATSKTECCFRNMVERMMEKASTPEAILSHRFPSRSALRITAK